MPNNPFEEFGGVALEDVQEEAPVVNNDPFAEFGGVSAEGVLEEGKHVLKDPDYVSLPNYIKYKLGMDTAQKAYSLYGASAMQGKMTDEEALRRGTKERDYHIAMAGPYKDLSLVEHPIKGAIGEAAQQIPYMVSSTFEGLKWGLPMGMGFGTIAAVAGQAGPQVAFPEEIITVPGAFVAGMKTGFAYGVIKNILEREGGSMYLDMVGKGISRKTAQPIALVAGTLTGVVELGEMFLVGGPVVKKTFGGLMRKQVAKTLSTKAGQTFIFNFIKKYAKTVGMEIAEEEIQNAIQLGGQSLAAAIEKNPDAQPSLEEWKAQLLESAPRMAAGLGLLSLPGAAIDARGETQTIRKEAIKKEVETLVQDLAQEKDINKREDIIRQFRERVGIKEESVKPKEKQVSEFIKPEKSKPDVSGITPLQRQIQGMEERQARVEIAQDALQEIDTVRQYFKGRITKYRDAYLKEELQGTPAFCITKEGGLKPDEAIEELRNHFGVEVNDEVGLKEYLQGLERSRKDLIDEIKSNRPELITKRETTLLNEKIKATEQGIREGRIQTKEEISRVQGELIEMIESAKLPLDERGKFLRLIKNIQTKEDLARELPKVVSRLRQMKEKQTRSEIVGNIKKSTERAKSSSSIATEYAQMIDALVNEFELQGHRTETIEALQGTREYIERAIKEGKEIEMPKEVLKQLDILERKPLAEISTEELEELSDTIDELERIGQAKLRLRQMAEEQRRQAALAEIRRDAKPLEEKESTRAQIGEKLNAGERLKNKYIDALNRLQDLDLAITPMDVIFDLLDGFKKYAGANYQTFKQTIDKAFTVYLQLKNDAENTVRELANKLKLNVLNFERIGVYAAKMQEGGTEKLINMGLTEQEIENIILTEEETKLYDLMREKLETFRPLISEIMRLVYNEPFYAVKNYFPFMTDFEKMSASEIRSRFGDSVEQFGLAPKKNVKHGFAMRRVGGKQKIKLNAMEVFLKHVDNAAYFVTVGKETKWLGELAASPEYAEAVGELGQELVRDWVDLIARKGKIAGERHNILDTFRKHTGAAVLAYRLSSTLIQPTALMDGASLLGNYAFDGAYKISSSREWRKFILDNFPEVKGRIGDDPAFLEFGEGKGVISEVEKAGFWALQNLDRLTALSIAAGAYQKYCNENNIEVDFSNPNQDGIDYAQRIVRRTQSSSFFKDAPSILTRDKITHYKSVNKLIFQFQSFMLNRWSLVRHDLWRAGIKEGRMGQAMNIFFFLSLATITEVVIRRGVRALIDAVSGDEPDDEERAIEQEIIENGLQTVPFLGSIVQSFKYGSNPIPAVEFSNKFFRKLSASFRAEDDDKKINNFIRAILLNTPGGTQWEQLFGKLFVSD